MTVHRVDLVSGWSIEDARRIQVDLGLEMWHVVWFDPDAGFVVAHTDEERAEGMVLGDCAIHRWLVKNSLLACCFSQDAGWYQVYNVHSVEGLAL